MSGVPSFLVPPGAAVAVFLLVLACGTTVGAASAQTPAWRYDLHPGDHLIYRYTFQRQTHSNEEQTQVEARFRTHVLVAADHAGRISLGFQRNFERYNVDRDRIYLTGFSNGGTGALYFATLWPHRFAAVVSLMGEGQCNEEVKAGLPNLGNLPLLFVHGENDPRITPDCSTTTHAAVTDLHPAIKPELKILPHRAHDIALDSDDGLTLAFFKNKLHDPFPRVVNVTLSDSLAARGYWVEILDGKPGKSSVEARVKADNTVEIHSHDVKTLRLHLRRELLPKPGDVRIVWNGKKMFNGPLRDVCALPAEPTARNPKLDVTDTRDLDLP